MRNQELAKALLDNARAIADDIVAWRRTIHRNPELGLQEKDTQQLVLSALGEMGVEAVPVAGTGVLGIIKGAAEGEGRVIACRADMDALPIQEAYDSSYKSQVDGKMHACGHDAHTAMLLGAARLLSSRREELPGTVKLFFQPAEEGPGGAVPMIEAGVMKNPTVDAVIGAHVQSGMDTGTIAVGGGYATAASDTAYIKIIGVGGHGAHPHLSVDAIAVAAQVVNTLQTIVSRETSPLDPVVITVGTIKGGYRANIIAPEVEMTATIRSMRDSTRQQLPRRIERIVAGICQTMNAKYEFEYTFGYGSLYNDPGMAELVRRSAVDVVGSDNVFEMEPSMGAEDFSYFAKEAPGAFFRIGVRNEDKGIVFPGHHPKFDVDEEGLPYGSAVMANTAWRFLVEGIPNA